MWSLNRKRVGWEYKTLDDKKGGKMTRNTWYEKKEKKVNERRGITVCTPEEQGGTGTSSQSRDVCSVASVVDSVVVSGGGEEKSSLNRFDAVLMP